MNTKRSVWAKLGRGLSVLPALPLLSLWAGGLMGRGESIGDVGRVGFYPIIEGPLIVANRPVVARWRASIDAVHFTGVFERNRGGDCRNEMYLLPGAAPLVTLWSVRENCRIILNYRRRSVAVLGAPDRSPASGWRFPGLHPICSDEYQAILNQRTRKVVLMDARSASEAGHCWISDDLGLVLREEIQIAGRTTAWEIIELNQAEPSEDVLRMPPDFTEWPPAGDK